MREESDFSLKRMERSYIIRTEPCWFSFYSILKSGENRTMPKQQAIYVAPPICISSPQSVSKDDNSFVFIKKERYDELLFIERNQSTIVAKAVQKYFQSR